MSDFLFSDIFISFVGTELKVVQRLCSVIFIHNSDTTKDIEKSVKGIWLLKIFRQKQTLDRTEQN